MKDLLQKYFITASSKPLLQFNCSSGGYIKDVHVPFSTMFMFKFCTTFNRLWFVSSVVLLSESLVWFHTKKHLIIYEFSNHISAVGAFSSRSASSVVILCVSWWLGWWDTLYECYVHFAVFRLYKSPYFLNRWCCWFQVVKFERCFHFGDSSYVVKIFH